MHHFFASPEQIAGDQIRIEGGDVNHIKNVLRMKPGEKLLVSDGKGRDYLCSIGCILQDAVEAFILSVDPKGRELPSRIWLFQGLPKSDKMELIIQKAVELGVYAIAPVSTRNTVVKLEPKKEEAKLARWRAIALSAAKQSKRSLIPQVMKPMTLEQAYAFVEEQGFHTRLIPYEHEQGTKGTAEELSRLGPGQDVAVFIGPEGGFEECEIEEALLKGVRPVSLGKRILRTETAGLVILSAVMLRLEGAL